MPSLSLRFDLRHQGDPRALTVAYREALAMAGFADEVLEVDRIQLSEHHACDDGYCPSPLVLAAALAGATRSACIMVAASVLPLHDPVRVAEDAAVADLAAGGRLAVVFVAGYRPDEFTLFGRDFDARGDALAEGVEIVKRLWAGEGVERDGRTLPVRPSPAAEPRPLVLLGGSSPSAARRAARHGDGFMASLPDPAHVDAYLDERARLGRDRGVVLSGAQPIGVVVVDDVEAGWHQVGPHLLHEARTYGRWENERPGANPYPLVADVESLRSASPFAVVTPDQCVELWRQLGDDETLLLHPLVGGVDPAVGWRSLRLFADEVLPALDRKPATDGPPGRKES